MKQKIKRKELRAKRKELLAKSIKQRAMGMKRYALCSMLYALCSMLFVLLGCTPVTTSPVKESFPPQRISEEPKEAPVITGIEIQDYTVSITVNKPFIYTIYRPGDPYKIVVDLPDVDVGVFNSRIVSDKAGITEIVPSQIKSPSFMARFEMLLQTPSIIEQEYKNNALIVKIKEEPPPPPEPAATSMSQFDEQKQLLSTSHGPEAQIPVEKTVTEEVKGPEILVKDRCRSYLEGEENINFDFQDQDIVPVFRLFADISGCNLFLHPDVKGRCTMKFKDVPWNQALDTILKTFSLGKSVEGNIVRIAPHTVFAKESEEAAKAMEAGIKAEPLATRIFPISYAKVKEVETAVKNSKILTPRGSSSVDERTSSMFIKDAVSVFPEIENLLATLDKPTPQVLIEARIVEISISDKENFGIQWGAFFNSTNTLSSAGGSPGLNTGTFTGENYIVDFPGDASAGAGSGITFGILNPAKTLGLDLQISALETMSKGKIISNPRIVTTNNVAAKIMQGESIPYTQPPTDVGGLPTTTFKDVAISIEVTPHITPANSIIMVVKATKEELIEFVLLASGSAPRTSKIEANTQVRVENGETMVIGGMYKKVELDSSSGVPGLMNIPVLGWLFKKKGITEDTRELLIFITPRIVQKQ